LEAAKKHDYQNKKKNWWSYDSSKSNEKKRKKTKILKGKQTYWDNLSEHVKYTS